jgi:hypothetical protein
MFYCTIVYDTLVKYLGEPPINFTAETSDYSATPIALIDPNNRTLTLGITGASPAAIDETINWTVWLDINDDGIYTRDEIVTIEEIAIGQAYGWNPLLYVSVIPMWV